MFAQKQTITLTQGTLSITESLTITGPAAGVAVDGNKQFNVFFITSGTPSSPVTLTGLTIQNGYALSGEGGGLANFGTATLTGCTLTQNSAYFAGGGLANFGTVTLTSCSLTGNSATDGEGGGLYNDGTATLTNCTITKNSHTYFGAGVYSDNFGSSGGLTLTGCVFAQNITSGDGGGLFNSTGTATLTNCVFTDNSAGAGGGLENGGTITLTACTFTANSSDPTDGGGIFNFGPATLTNDILYGDTNGEVSTRAFTGPGSTTATHCDIGETLGSGGDGVADGGHNLFVDPLFVGAPTDLHLQAGSHCLGAGATQAQAPSGVTIPTTDFDGNTRPSPPSIGAYDAKSASAAVATMTTLTGFSNPYTIQDNNNLTATVTAADGTTPSGTVSFYKDGNDIGDIPLVNGKASVNIGAFFLGSFYIGPHTFSASYSPTTGYQASSSPVQNVTAQAKTDLFMTSSVSPSYGQPGTLAYGKPVTFTAELVADGGNNNIYGNVLPTDMLISFYDGNRFIGTAPQVSSGGGVLASLTVSNFSVGTHTITASYPGETNVFASTSAPVIVTATSVTAGTARLAFTNVSVARSGGTVTVTGTLLNSGTATATGAQITRAHLGAVAATADPGPYTIPAGSSQAITLQFVTSATGRQPLTISGTAGGGLTFSYGQNILVP